MGRLHVEAEGTTSAEVEAVWALVSDANTYAKWGPWNDGGYDPSGKGPSQPGSIQWFHWVDAQVGREDPRGRRTIEDRLHRGARNPGQELSGRGHVGT